MYRPAGPSTKVGRGESVSKRRKAGREEGTGDVEDDRSAGALKVKAIEIVEQIEELVAFCARAGASKDLEVIYSCGCSGSS